MKKIFYLVLSLGLVFSLTGCGEKENVQEQSNVDEEIHTSVEEETTEKIYFSPDNLYIYDTFQIISLDENPTTGYRWMYTIDDETVATVESDEYTQNEAEEGMAGVGGIHTFRLSGLQTGITKITFRNMRSWEGEDSAVETVVFDITVNENGAIAVIGENHQ